MTEHYFVWDEISDELMLIGPQTAEDDQIKRHRTQIKESGESRTYCPHLYLVLSFQETLNQSQKIRFRKRYLRKVSPNEPDIIILQDIKDLVLYLLASPVTPQFIQFFHLPIVDRFLRALIIYFQYFIKVWEELIQEHANTMKKALNPLARGHRSQYTIDLHCLRCVLAKEYADLVAGCQDTIAYHHMAAGITQSQGEKDLRIFEVLIFMAHRVVWIALQRKYFNLIEVELHRLFRTEAYNIGERRSGGQIMKDMLQNDINVLYGQKVQVKRRLLRNTPLIRTLVYTDCDYRLLTLGDNVSSDPRITYLQETLFDDEEKLAELDITIGILGKRRADFDVMLMPNEEKSDEAEESPMSDKKMFEKRISTLTDPDLTDSPQIEKVEKIPLPGSDTKITDAFPIKMKRYSSRDYDRRREEARRKWILREIQRHGAKQTDTFSMMTVMD